MLGSADYTASNGTTVVLAVGALVNDLISTESFYVSSVLNALPVTGGTISGNLVVTGTASITGVTTLTGGLNTPLAVTSGGTGVATSTGSGANVLGTSPTLTTPTFDSASLVTISGTAPLYMCRAWVNFNGSGTVAIRASGNVSSITDNGTGDYTVNFTTAMSDANYAGVSGLTNDGSTATANPRVAEMVNTSSSAMRMLCMDSTSGVAGDMNSVYVAIFR